MKTGDISRQGAHIHAQVGSIIIIITRANVNHLSLETEMRSCGSVSCLWGFISTQAHAASANLCSSGGALL